MDSQATTQTAEMDTLDKRINNLLQRLHLHRQNIQMLENNQAVFAVGNKQVHLSTQIQHEQESIVTVRGELGELLIQKLTQLIADAQLSPKELRRLLEQSRPRTYEKRLASISTPDLVASALWEMRNWDDKAIPVMEFSERLAV